MSEHFEPIYPGEPFVPRPEPSPIIPGRSPSSRPLELPQNPRQLDFDEDAPKITEPELNLGGSGGIKPPIVRTNNGYDWPDWRMVKGKWTFPLQSVDEVSQYMSFRNLSSNYLRGETWGIWVSEKGYKEYALALRVTNPLAAWQDCCQAAWGFITSHQANHFLIDRAVLTLEIAAEVNGGGSQHLWVNFRKLHQHAYSALEESTACAYSLRNGKTKFRKYYQLLLEHQPDGYKYCSQDGLSIITQPSLSHAQAVSRLLSTFLKPQTHIRALGLHGLMLYESHIQGINGDLYFTMNGKKVELPIYMAL
jgi:hypothetical protein